VLAVGEVLDVSGGARRRTAALPIDVARTIEELLSTVELDFVHVHEPFAPSTSNAALRHSRALNVASFHSSTERLLSTLVARRFVESFFGRLDARTAATSATAELMERYFPADYRLVADGEQAATELEQIYRDLAARRHPLNGDPKLKRVLDGRPLIDVDLHMHTDHSPDCATPVEVLLATARAQGLGAIAVTDHNEISGALEARAQARSAGVKVIVAEEVKTAGQGEVIGLFIEEKIPRGLSLEETVAEIRRRAASSTCRTPSIGCTRCPTTSTCSRSSTTWMRSRCSTRAWLSAPSTMRPPASRPSTGSSRAPARTRTSPRV
jgi:hypothetical protein